MTILISILALSVLVFFHEFGHYIVARLQGVHVIEFSIGMGKELLSWVRKETKYTIRLFPVGGYCNLLSDSPNTSENIGFNQKTTKAKAAIVLAGPIANLLIALILLFSIFFFIVGVPQTSSTIIGSVMEDSPAYNNLKEGDKILQINRQSVEKWSDIANITSSSNKMLSFLVEREDSIEVVFTGPPEEGVVGISPPLKKLQFIPSMFMGINNTCSIFMLTFQGLHTILFSGNTQGILGPIGIALLLDESLMQFNYMFVFIIAVISINLAIINLLPIPGLDGGRLSFLLFEGIFKRKIDPRKEAIIHSIGIMFLLFLIIFVTLQDFIRFVLQS